MNKISFSKAALIFSLGTFLLISFNIKLWKNENLVGSDGFSYYAYLPALIIKQDIKLTFLDTDKQSYFNKLWYSVSPTGVKFTKMGAGLAVMQFPFFILADFYAKATDYARDGFSLPYRFALCMSCIFYCVLGLFFLRKTLLKYFPDSITGSVLIAIAMGTNLLNYVVLDPMMSHAYNFFLFSLLIYLTVIWHEKPTFIHSILLGISCGMILLSRSSNGLIFIFPALYGITEMKSIKEKFSFLFQNKIQVVLVIAFCVIAFFPQLWYWKITTGQWFYYSYRHEKFYLLHPHLFDGLFGFRKGWLIYTPVMIFALAGIYFLKDKLKDFFLPILIYIPVNIYIVLSWWCWWYGGSFGMRSLIESYALLAFPMASVFFYFHKKKKILKWSFASLVALMVAFNGFQTYQYKNQFITYDCMTWKAYKSVFLKWNHLPDNFMELQECPDYENAIIGLPERPKNEREHVE